MEQMEIIWLALMAVLLIIEIMTLGLTTIWFAAGALFAFLTALLGLNQGIQIGVFVVESEQRCCTAVFHKTMGCEVSEYQNGQDEYGGSGWQISQSHCGYQ